MNTELEYKQTVTTSGGGADVCHGKFEAASGQDAIIRVRAQVKNSASTSLYPVFFIIVCNAGDITSAGTFSAAVVLKRKKLSNALTGNTTYKTCSANPTVTTGTTSGQKIAERAIEGHSQYDSGFIELPAGKVALVYSNDSNTLSVDLLNTVLE